MVIIITTYKSYLFHPNSGESFVPVARSDPSYLGCWAGFLATSASRCSLAAFTDPVQVLRAQISTGAERREKCTELRVGGRIGVSACHAGNTSILP